MKVILNKDLSPLGEEGDVKEVAKGYARNFLFPRNIALPYNDKTIKLFESRREEIETRKVQKRTDAAGLRERLESLNLEITMPAGANGKLYGAVTSQTVMDELAKQGYQIERKRIELAGNSFKNVGKYKVTVKLYESAAAEITISVLGQEIKTETKAAPAKGRRRRDYADSRESVDSRESGDSKESTGQTAGDAQAPEAASGGTGEVSSAETAPAEVPSRDDGGAASAE